MFSLMTSSYHSISYFYCGLKFSTDERACLKFVSFVQYSQKTSVEVECHQKKCFILLLKQMLF
jgi:hypothetical protein